MRISSSWESCAEAVDMAWVWLSRASITAAGGGAREVGRKHFVITAGLFIRFSTPPSSLQMAGWLETSGVLPKFDVCIGKGLDTPGGEFYEASEALISVFDLISGMSMASGDMRKNAVTIQKLSAGGTTLKALVEAECADKSEKELKKIAGGADRAASSLLRLARALNFVIKLLDVMIEDKTKKLSDCVMAGYEVSLKPHHGSW